MLSTARRIETKAKDSLKAGIGMGIGIGNSCHPNNVNQHQIRKIRRFTTPAKVIMKRDGTTRFVPTSDLHPRISTLASATIPFVRAPQPAAATEAQAEPASISASSSSNTRSSLPQSDVLTSNPNRTSLVDCLNDVHFLVPDQKRLREIDMVNAPRLPWPSLEECARYEESLAGGSSKRARNRLVADPSSIHLTSTESSALDELLTQNKLDFAWNERIKSEYSFDQANRILDLRAHLISYACGAYREEYRYTIPKWEAYEKPLLQEAIQGAAIFINSCNLSAQFPQTAFKASLLEANCQIRL